MLLFMIRVVQPRCYNNTPQDDPNKFQTSFQASFGVFDGGYPGKTPAAKVVGNDNGEIRTHALKEQWMIVHAVFTCTAYCLLMYNYC